MPLTFAYLEMAELHYQTPSDEVFAPQVSSSRAWRQRAQGAGATSIVLLLLAAAVHGTTYQATETAIEDTEACRGQCCTGKLPEYRQGERDH